MNRARCPFKPIASWFFCALIFTVPADCFGQIALPPLTPVGVSNFTIPFELAESTETFSEVELLVSKDRGKRWFSVGKQPIASKKFAFHADTSGEYWFAFRTITHTGNVSPLSGLPQLRVLVENKSPIIVLPSKPSESGPLTPPKPMRYRDGGFSKPIQSALQQSAQSQPAKSDESAWQTADSAESKQTEIKTDFPADSGLGPKLPGFDPFAEKNPEGDLLDNLMSGMDPFLDIQPTTVKSMPNNVIAADKANVSGQTAAKVAGSAPPGGIIGIFLNNTAVKPQIFVRWNKGTEPWQDAQIDVFRSPSKEGHWSPIAINLPNNGEYWWFLTQEDLKPFYITVRIRSLRGGISGDVTQTAITIDPQISLPKSASLGH